MDHKAKPHRGGGRAASEEISVNQLLRDLRRAGSRVTEPRRAVIEALVAAQGEHLTADDLAARVRRSHPDVHRATVYRTLDTLQELGVISHVHLGHGPSTFHVGERPHHHAVCVGCGAVVELPLDVLDGVADRLRIEAGWELEHQHFALSARCPSCSQGRLA